MSTNRKYEFHWDLLGDLQAGRPNLGPTTRLEIYRLMQFTFRDVLEKKYGADETDRIFYQAGLLAGKEFYSHLVQKASDFETFIAHLTETLASMSMGILRVEKSDLETGNFILTVSEDLDCSGLSEQGDEICTYDEGFITGILESYTGRPFRVKEIDCWCTGDRTCRFTAKMIKP
jgi:predicted hydrocarbon binding protein